MWPFSSVPSRDSGRLSSGAELEMAREEYLAISSSPLRLSEPAWFALAEEVAWEHLCRAEGRTVERAGDLVPLA